MCAQLLSCVQLFIILWTVAHQAPLSMEFSRQEYWSGLLFPTPGDLPDPGIEPESLVLCCAKSFQSRPTLCDNIDCSPPGSSVPWNFPGKNTGVVCHFLLQGIFPTQGSNPCLLYLLDFRQILYLLSHQGSPKKKKKKKVKEKKIIHTDRESSSKWRLRDYTYGSFQKLSMVSTNVLS